VEAALTRACPNTAQEAVDIANSGGLAVTTSITVRKVAGDEFERIIDYELGPMPEPIPVSEGGDYDLDEVPF